ncbi:hypothetical protein SAMN05192568_104126 [Methylobacterium pseudosasicola]|uniref:Uncharacterized protein n=1 Tax=Methylobacterium pseudosasicola TaxID=582667 RepID=A0A1I4SBF7_9HYPH|nr:hypothetical protein SAMN05192568_104126 [Methylobacterium pseudosasicola]
MADAPGSWLGQMVVSAMAMSRSHAPRLSSRSASSQAPGPTRWSAEAHWILAPLPNRVPQLPSPHRKTETALEAAGVIFIEENGEGPGVRLRKA